MQFILPIHNLLRWAVLLFGLLSVLKAIGGLSSGRMYNASDNRTGLFFMISCDLQLLIGLVLFFMNGWMDKFKAGAEVMKDPVTRFFTVEHAGMMILAWILVHIGRTTVKRTMSDKGRHRKTLIYFGIALLIILASIPWPFRQLVGRPYFHAF